MANKKKLSLKEFFDDTSLGSWGDDDFDPSSISVPISQSHHSHDYLTYSSNSHSTFSSRASRPFDGAYPKSPPFIVKFSNIPSHFGIEDLEDLMHSRFMGFIKLKLFWEINFDILDNSRDPLEAINKRKKVSFVELQTLQDFEKVLKWNDLYLDHGLGKIQVHVGNFDNFRVYNDLNQKISEFDDPMLSSQRRRVENSPRALQSSINNRIHNHEPLRPLQRLHDPANRAHDLPPKQVSAPQSTPAIAPTSSPTPAPPANKPSPFGKARPVDTLSKELEVEKKLKAHEINSTTFTTLGRDADANDEPPTSNGVGPSDAKDTEINSTEVVAKVPRSKKKTMSSPIKKSAKLVPATNPEVNVWNKPTDDIQESQSLNSDAKIINVSPSVFQKKKKSAQETKDETLERKKVILKRRTADPKEVKNGRKSNSVTPTPVLNSEIPIQDLKLDDKGEVDKAEQALNDEPKSELEVPIESKEGASDDTTFIGRGQKEAEEEVMGEEEEEGIEISDRDLMLSN